jgi:hypothetical protein
MKARLAGELEVSPDSPLPVGMTEIAERAGVKQPTVEQWIRRHEDFPAPRWQVGGRRAWDWRQVAVWLEGTGRIVTVVLECLHLKSLPAPVTIPDVTDCPVCGYEREIAGLFDGDTST